METLECILEINIAILSRKNHINNSLPNIVESLFKKKDKISDNDLNSEAKKESINDFQNEKHVVKLKKGESLSYDPLKALSQYLSIAKDKIYGYYSKIKESFAEIAGKVGYTDKLLNEIEDWGVIYFKTAYHNLSRLSPLGHMYRELQKLWICISKKVK